MGRVLRTTYRSAPFILAIVTVVLLLATMPLLGAAQTPEAATTEAQNDPPPAETVAPAEAPPAPPAVITTQSETTTIDDGPGANPPVDESPLDTGEGQSDLAPSIKQDTIEPTEPATVAPTEPALPTAPATVPVEPTLTPTVTPLPTLTPTPRIPNTDTLTPASDMSPVTLQPGQSHQYSFIYAVTTPRTGTAVHAELRADGGSADGWLLQAQAGAGALIGAGTTVDMSDTGTLTPGGTFPVTIVIQAPATVTAPQAVSLSVGSTATTESGEVENGVASESLITSITAAPLPTPTPAPKQMRAQAVALAATWCHDPSLTAPLVVTYTCDSFAGTNGTTYTLAISNLPSGWRYTFTGTGWVNSSASGTSNNSSVSTFKPVGNSNTVSGFSISIGPDSQATNPASSGSPTLTISYKSGSTTVTGPSDTLSASFCAPTVSASSLAFPNSTWNGGSYPAVNASLGLTISAGSGCSGFSNSWSVQVSATDMTGSGSSIPANSMSYAGGSPGPTGVAPIQSDVALSGNATTIATGSSSVTSGTTWNAPFTLQPPPDAPPGDYSGTITITVASGG